MNKLSATLKTIGKIFILTIFLLCIQADNALSSGGLSGRYGKVESTLWGPIQGAIITSNLNYWPIATNKNGFYSTSHYIPPCPGTMVTWPVGLTAQLKYTTFNPKSDYIGSYLSRHLSIDVCFGLDELLHPTTLQLLLAKTELQPIGEGFERSNTRRVDFLINLAVLSGMAKLYNIERIGESTEYIYEAGDDPDIQDRGLLKEISWEDLKNTDIYIYNRTKDRLIASMEGISENNINEEDAIISYQVLMRGPRELDEFGGVDKRVFATTGDSGVLTDEIIAQNEVWVYLVNRTTGYIGRGMAEINKQDSVEGGFISFSPDGIIMRPPNLEVKAERMYKIDTGITQGETPVNVIGFEGSGLTSDVVISVKTKWLDKDGSLLPENLPGYTGRLAKVVDSQTDLNQIAQFPIISGSHQQLIHFPMIEVDRTSFYVHVNGDPVDRNPNFSTIGAGIGALEYRPKNYVPIKVPVYNEDPLQAPIYTKQENDPYYIYRPEMQFSLYDLNVEITESIDSELSVNEFLGVSRPDLLYSIYSGDLSVLERFGNEPDLVFAIGGVNEQKVFDEMVISLNSQDNVNLFEPEHINLLQPDDFLTIQLFQKGESQNVLWEHVTPVIEAFDIIERDCPVLQGKSTVIKAITRPENREVIWKKEVSSPDVDVIMEPSSRSVTLKVQETSARGWVKLRATDAEVPTAFKEVLIPVGCPECSDSGEAGSCSFPGNNNSNMESIDTRFSLGKALGGQLTGELIILSDEPAPALSTPKALWFSSLSQDFTVLYGAGGGVRQVVAPQTFVDIVEIDEYRYDMHFYDPADRRGKVDGFYNVNPMATPFVTWRIENPDASADVYHRLRLAEIRNSGTIFTEYLWDEAQSTWHLSKGNGQKILSKTEQIESETGNRIVTEIIKNASDTVASTIQTTFHTFAWGEEIIKEVQDPDGAALTTATTYYEDPGQKGYYSNVKSRIHPDGSWDVYHYDYLGRIVSKASSWLDTGSTAPPSSTRVTTYDYDPVDGQDAQTLRYKYEPRTITEQIEGKVVSKTYHAYLTGVNDEQIEIVEQCADVSDSYQSVTNLRTVRTYSPDGGDAASERIQSVSYPDGRLDTYTYESGVLSGDTFTPGTGDNVRVTEIYGTTNQPDGIADKTIRKIRIENSIGNTVRQETHVYTGTGYEMIQWESHVYDDMGHLIGTLRSDGTQTSSDWGCCNKESDTDARGIERYYTHDDLKRVETSTKEGTGTQSDIITTYTYDAAGRRLTQTISADGLTLASSNQYDGAGRIETTTDAAGLVTGYDYTQDGRMITMTRPGNITEITTRYIDGRTKSITGTGVVSRYYTYGVNEDGSQWTQIHTGSASSPMWEKTTVDALGRTIRVEKPGYSGIEVTENVYNNKGQLEKTSVTGQVDTLYAYDALGNQIRTGLDIDSNGALENSSSDRINETETAYAYVNDNWWQETIQRMYAEDGSDSAVTVGTQRIQVSGLGTGGKVGETASVDIHGNLTVSTTVVDADIKTETRTIDYPDSDIDAVSVIVNGLLASSTSKSGVAMTYEYDSLGRRTGVVDPRTGTTITHYNDKGQIDYVEDPALNRTTFAYDPNTGRKVTETNALNKVTRYAYNNLGQVTRTWGDTTYPVEYDYDAYGRMEEMHTYRSGTNWSSESWPEGETPDVTKWHYQEATGLLTGKEDASGKRVNYTYTDGGKLETRTWARTDGGNPLVTTYNYDPDTGELLGIDYSDSTPDIAFTYDRLGRQQTITDAVGSRTFAYNDELQLETETITGLYEKVITRTYDTSDVVGRSTGFNLGVDYSVQYGYDNNDRFNSIDWNVTGQTDSSTYGYLTDSDLIETLSTTSGMNTTYAYETNRNLRTNIENAYNATVVSSYGYEYDELGRRTSVTNSGTAFSQAAFNKFDYNDRSELTNSNRYEGTDINNLTVPVDPETRAYDYDPIGNRTDITIAADTGSYNTNNFNQYSSHNIPGGGTNSFTYDDDGNLTSIINVDGSTNYIYNAENRLISVEPDIPSDGDTKVEFIYDYMGRRIQKQVYTYTAMSYELSATSYYVYDGWNLVEELITDNGSPITKRYVWGLDLSQSLQGVGGIGGLLAVVDSTDTYLFNYDGNGNVGQLVNGSDGSIVAHYEYDPYGNTITSAGDYADDNTFRFSTKYHDAETDLCYYGYRYYSPEMGRWLNRDKIEEKGGLNLYGYVLNSPISLSDVLGLGTYKEGAKPPKNEQPLDRSTYNAEQIGFIHFLWEFYSTIGRAKLTQLGGIVAGYHDAQRHLEHFLGNTGSTYTIRFSGMNRESERAREHFYSELLDAVIYIEKITKSRDGEEISIVTVDEEHSENSTGNWLYAVGEYRTWAKGKAVKCGQKYKLEWSFHFRDNYDWSMNPLLEGGFVFDREMAYLHRYGMAQEYEMVGEHKVTVEWEKSDYSSINDAVLK